MNMRPPVVLDSQEHTEDLMDFVEEPGDQSVRMSPSIDWLTTRMGLTVEAARSLLAEPQISK